MFFPFLVFLGSSFQLPQAMEYRIDQGKQFEIATQMTFAGDIPIFGGQQGKAEAKMTFHVKGLPEFDSKMTAEVNLTQFQVSFNGTTLPVTLKDAVKYFPATQFTFDTFGSYTALSVPPKPAPVRLPGLSIENVPRISFLPLKLSEGLKAEGSKADVSDSILGGSQDFQIKVDQVTTIDAKLSFTFQSKAAGFEDAAEMIVNSQKDAESRVLVTENGKGSAVYSYATGLLTDVKFSGEATYKVYNLATHKISYRHLKRSVTIHLSQVPSGS